MSQITPIFVSVKDAAQALGLSAWAVYKLLDKQVIESRYAGKKRLVLVASLHEYAAGLPATPPQPPVAS